MTDELERLKANVQQNVSEICHRRIEKLVNLWKGTFENDICVEHLSRIHEHVEIFFDDVEQESRSRQTAIKDSINDLIEEGEHLKQLLSMDINLQTQPGTPLHTFFKELEVNIATLRNELDRRVQKIDNYLDEQRALCDELGESFRPLPKEPLPTDAEMKEFRHYLDRMHEEKAKRLEYFEIARNNIQTYYSLMGVLPETDEHQTLAYGELQPTHTNMTKMKLLETKMASQFEDFKADMDSMRVKLAKLWEFLQVPRSEQTRFDRYIEYNSTNHLKLFEEVQRCEKIKRQNMQAYIDSLRKNILIFWDMCYKSQEERSRFVHFNTDIYTEDQLELHEMELADLKNFYDKHEEIFKAYEDRLTLWDKMKELDAKANDPGRFNNRGGQLLKEEKERKALNARLPKLEDKLREMCRQYEEQHNKPFTINGRSVEDIITEDYERRAEEKQANRRHPQSGVGTPLYNSRMMSNTRTPQTASGMKSSTSRFLAPSSSRTNSTRMLPPSSQKASASGGVKRRLSPSNNTPAAKRNLLAQMDTSRPKSVSRKGFVSPAVRRQSLKRQSIKKRKSMGRRRRENIPPQKSDTSTTHSESISYDVFENLVHSKGLRSSMQPKSPATPRLQVTPSTPNSPGGSRKKLTTNRNFQMMI